MRKYKCTNGWTKQLMKNRIVEKNSGQKSGKNEACYYSTANDTNRCSVGCFIPDGHSGLGSHSDAFGLFQEYPDLLEEMPLSDTGMDAFQQEHDLTKYGVFIQPLLFNWIDANVEDL